jgi:hypothetical protein
MKRERDAAEYWDECEPLGERCVLLLIRLTQIMVVAWLAMELPLPFIIRGLNLKGPVVALAAVILIGKTVYDTLFYDHYPS